MKKDKYKAFNIKNIKPQGWIEDQLKTQLNSSLSHLYNYWPSIKDSVFVGGDNKDYERVPYFLDGYIPLVYLLDDKQGKKVINKYVNGIINNQLEDGNFKYLNNEDTDMWNVIIILKSLTTYASITNKSLIINVIYKGLKALYNNLNKYKLKDWGEYRWFEALIPIYYIYNLKKEDWLIDLAYLLHDQGFDYYNYYLTSFPKKDVGKGVWNLMSHGVNHAMAIKCYSLYYKLTNNKEELKKTKYMINKLYKYHGVVTGTFNADECLASNNPSRGSELCLIVEAMYSFEWLIKIEGKDKYIDMLERLAFNALLSAFSNDMNTHQYDNQVNAPFIIKNNKTLWNSNNEYANLYGLEPNFGCCTANFHQGLPKFVASSILKSKNELFICSYIPVKIKDKDYDINIDSYYPFDNKIKITINSNKEKKIRFHLINNKDIIINDKKYENKKGNVVFTLNKGLNIFNIIINDKPEFIIKRNNVSLINNNLVYALKIKEKKEKIDEYNYEYHNLSYPSYILKDLQYETIIHEVDKNKSPFVSLKPYIEYKLKAYKTDYKIIGNYLISKNKIINNKEEDVSFIPIAINKLHLGNIKFIKNKK